MKETIKNLAKAFIGESQARNRYTYYAKIARQEGFEQVAEVFLISAENEKVHAKRLFEHIQELKEKSNENFEEIAVEAVAPTVYGDTVQNLKAAIAGEHYEHSFMYPEFAKVAEEEGLPVICIRLKAIAKAEVHHEERYKKLLEVIESGTAFKKDKEVWWTCRECGYVHRGTEPPKKCPACDHPTAFYQIKCEEY